VDTEPGAYSGNNPKSMRMTAADDAGPRLLRLLMAAHRHSSTEIFEWDQGDRFMHSGSFHSNYFFIVPC
jgi:hypothetical protein